MVFWGIEVKPGTPQSYHPHDEQGKLHVTQATLGAGQGKESSVIQCSTGDNTPIYLCSLLPNNKECCPLNLEFDDDDEPVEFSVTGNRSIHLTGFLEPYDQEYEDEDEDESDGIDIGSTDSDELSEYDSEDDNVDDLEDFIDRNLDMYRNSSAPKSGVVIEEIEDEENSDKDNKAKGPKKKSKASKDEKAKKQIVPTAQDLESEDEDGLPISKTKAPEPEIKSGEKMDVDNDVQGSNKKRKAKASEQDGGQESVNKSKKKKNQKEKKKGETAANEKADEKVHTENVPKKQETSQKSSGSKAQNGSANKAMSDSSKTPTKSAEKNKKKNSSEEATVESKSNSSGKLKYPSGLIVEDLGMGKPNGKKATSGKEVRVRYIGKLEKNGKIFDSNIGKAPFKFRLGAGQVIKGWDIGVNGMRVGDKRKLTIPPSMGYGQQGAGGQIPPNAWLSFDVELLDVK